MKNRFASLPFGAMIGSIENSSRRMEMRVVVGDYQGRMEGFERTLKKRISLCRQGEVGCNGGLTGGLDQVPRISFLEILISKP